MQADTEPATTTRRRRDPDHEPRGLSNTRRDARRRMKDDLKDASKAAAAAASEELEDLKSNDSVWFDGPLALTIVPPIGSYLTGGDFVRDGLILALLFYYLRALIKTPWDLYIKARARRPPPEEAFDVDDTPEAESEGTAKIRALARSELRFAELVYLSFCLVTPLLGTLLLRYVSSLLSTDGTITWFSTGLFVLATGVRPWRHLITLLAARTDDLQEIVHQPRTTSRVSREKVQELEETVTRLQDEIDDINKYAAHKADIIQLKATVDEGLEHAESQMRNSKRSGEVSRMDIESRFAEFDAKFGALLRDLESRDAVTNEVLSKIRAPGVDYPSAQKPLVWSSVTKGDPDAEWRTSINTQGHRRHPSKSTHTRDVATYITRKHTLSFAAVRQMISRGIVDLALFPVRVSQNILFGVIGLFTRLGTPGRYPQY